LTVGFSRLLTVVTMGSLRSQRPEIRDQRSGSYTRRIAPQQSNVYGQATDL
jgi:hypothetical protein